MVGMVHATEELSMSFPPSQNATANPFVMAFLFHIMYKLTSEYSFKTILDRVPEIWYH